MSEFNITKYSFFQETPIFYRRIGDSIMGFCLGLTPIIHMMPVSANAKLWITIIVAIFGLLAKQFTNFWTDIPQTTK